MPSKDNRAASEAGRQEASDAGMGKLRITYAVSSIGVKADQKATVLRLGLRRLGQTVEQPDSPAIRGMIHKVRHLVTVEEESRAVDTEVDA
jgi:large subunit ribosomal protein L30